MNFKIPVVGAIISFVLLFIINLIAGNAFGIVLLRTIISTAIIFGLLTAMIVIFKSVLGVDTTSFTSDNDNESDESQSVGSQFDFTVGDESSDGETGADGYGESDSGYEEQGSDYGGGSFDSDSDSGSSYDDGFSDVGTSGGSMTGDTIKDKLGYDATTEDLAKAIRTIMPKDD